MPEQTEPERLSLGQAIAELVQMFVDYVRQETGDVVREKIVLPTQVAGQVVAFALAAAFTLSLGIGFLSAALLMLLAHFVGWIAATAITGGMLALGAGGFTYAKIRRVQR